MFPATPAPTSTQRPFLATAALLILAIFLLGYHLDAEPVGRSSERRCHEVAREMVGSGDYLVPHYQGEVRLQKPPLYYWLAAASAKALGKVDLLSTRIPSAVAALALLLLVIAYVSRRHDRTTGLLAGALLLISFQFSTSGRRGDAEMWLALSGTCALFAFDGHARTGTRRSLVAFAGALTVGFLAKATAVFVTVLAPVAMMMFIRDMRRRASIRGTILAVVVAMTLGFAWYGWVLTAIDGASNTLLGDLVLPLGVRGANPDDAEHFQPPWYFVRQFFSVAFPIGLLLPLVVLRVRATRFHAENAAMRGVLIAACVPFLVFSILPQKQKHYLLPILPLYAIVVADALRSPTFTPRFQRWLRSSLACAGALAIVVSSVIALAASRFEGAGLIPSAPLLFVTIASGIVLVLRVHSATWRESVAVSTILICSLLANHHGRIEPWRESLDDIADAGLPLPDESRMREAAASHPMLAKAFDIDEAIEDVDKARLKLAASDAPP